MKAWVLNNIGEIYYKDVAEPRILQNEVLIEVKAAGICGSDIPRIYETGAHRKPLIPGHEFSGKVVKCGETVNKRWIGKRVGVFPLIPCKECEQCLKGKYEMCKQYSYIGSRKNGAFAEYVAVPEWNLIEIPDSVAYEEAAMLEPMAVAVHAMRRVEVSLEKTVVILGLGTIGQMLTMFLRDKGIKDIVVVGNKDFQEKIVGKFGISKEQYCDSRAQNISDFVREYTKGRGADVVFECVGKNETISHAINITSAGGQICLVGNPHTDMAFDKNTYWNILRGQLKIMGTWNSSYTGNFTDKTGIDDWEYAIDLLRKKRIHPVDLITHRFAIRDLEQGYRIMKNKSQDYVKVMMINS